jgi:hypothetical protein
MSCVQRSSRIGSGLLLGLLLAACGGGTGVATPAVANAPQARAQAVPAAPGPSSAEVPYQISADQLFDWVERQFGSLFTASPNSFALPYNGQSFTVRAYPDERYLGAANGVIYGLGDFTNGQLQSFGQIQDFACAVVPASCGPTPSTWSAPLTAPAEFVSQSKVVLDDLGNALAFWIERPAANGFAEQIMVSRRLAGGAWGAAQPASLGRETLFPNHKVALDRASGRAVLVWSQLTSAGAYDLWARTFDPRTGWSQPVRIEDLPKGIGEFDVGMDKSGHAIVTWVQLDTAPQRATNSLWANRFVPGQGWGTPERIESFDVNFGSEGAPSLAVAANGEAHVVWISGNLHIMANRFRPGSGWGTPVQVATDAGTRQSFYTPRVGADDAGHALLAWVQLDIDAQALQRTMVKRFDGTWSTTTEVVGAPQPTVSTIAPLHLSVGANGAAGLTWALRDGSILASVAAPNAPFAAPAAVKPAGTAEIKTSPQIGVDGAGNAFVTWAQRDVGFPSEDVWINHFVVGSGWQTSSRQEASTEPAYTPALSVNAIGQAMLVWVQSLSFNGPTTVFSRSFL